MHIKAPVLPLVIRAAEGAPKCLCTSLLESGAYVPQRKPTEDEKKKVDEGDTMRDTKLHNGVELIESDKCLNIQA